MSRTVAILVPARDTVMTSFAYDLARAMSFHSATTDDRVMLYTSHGTLIASQRMELARQALEEKADYLLWLDSDMRFPKETIGHLILRDKPIVAANYSTRRMPVKPVAMMDGAGKIDRVYTGPESEELQPVDYVGMGVMMVAGAHTMLLFLMARTPDAPITKEIKPTAAIAWKGIGYGEVRRGGQSIPLYDCPPERAIRLGDTLALVQSEGPWQSMGQSLRSVFIDTGENGIFSRGEFEAISTPGQMEFVTPEEIAESVIYEIKGGNTGHDIINALDNATLNPTYRAGFLFQRAREEMKKLEEEHNISSVAFEFLGPPRLSKLLYEAHLLFLTYGTIKSVLRASAEQMTKKLESLVRSNAKLRSEIISIGIPILLSDGKTLLRGPKIKIPPYRGEAELPLNAKNLQTWTHDGWVDLRPANMERWKDRFRSLMAEIDAIPHGESSSRQLRNKLYWNNFGEIDPGKLVGWTFTVEEKGKRMKA